ncbi:putative envelope protein ODV-E66-4 [Microplitis demolitor]|nr:putative envelope protein ODV-E66-4 [Microplitis demolitor]
MCDDAVKILQYCAGHKNDDASNYVTSVVKKLNEKLTTHFDVNNQPERFHWTEVSKSITRLLAVYISLSNYEDNEEVKRDICHHLINKIIPPLKPSLPWSYKSSDTIISLTLPRVYSNFMYDENKLKEEVKDNIFVLISEQYKNLHDNQELRDNFEYYDFYNNLYSYYYAAIKDTRLLEYRKIYEDDSITISY